MYLKTKSRSFGSGRINKRRVILITAIVVAVIAVVGIILLATSGRNLKDVIKKEVFGAKDAILTQKDGVLYITGDKLTYSDYNNKEIWTQKIFAKKLEETASENIIAVYNDKVVQAFDPAGNQLFTKEITGSVLDVRCGLDKVAVISQVQTEDKGQQKYLTVYGKQGNIIDTIDFASQNIIDIGFYGKNSNLWVLTLDTEGVIPISRIVTYEPGKSQTGSIDINGQLVEKLIVDDTSIYASGTNNLSIYSLFGEKKSSILIYGWNFHGEFMIEKTPVFLYVPRIKVSGAFDSIRVVETDGTDLTINLPPDVVRATIYNNKIYCLSKTKIYKYSMEGTSEDEYDLPYSIDSVLKVYGRYAFLVKGNDVFILPLP